MILNELFKHSVHLPSLITEHGVKNIYDAVSKCTRCGYCIENCPTYMILRKEIYNPRGRNQIIRMLIEGKYNDVNDTKEIIDSCLLCGRCTDVCYGKVKTPDIVLEARREEKRFGKSIFYKAIVKLRRNKKIFNLIIKILYFLKKIKLDFIADKLGLFDFLGFPSLSQASRKIIKLPKKLLSDEIENIIPEKNEVKWIYFLTCGTDYLFPETGKATLSILKKIYGNGIFMKNECCGLISYNYGNLNDAKKYALKNIQIYEELKKHYGHIFMVADCSSCVAFMKSYPQMFIDDEEKYEMAVEFSNNIKDIVELIKPQDIKKVNLEAIKDKKLTIHHSCKAYNDEGLKDNEEKVLKPILNEKLVEMEESNICCGGAGAYAFTKPEISNEILKRKILNIGKSQADIVIVSSTSCLLHIKYGTKKYYHCEVLHYSEILDKLINHS